MIQCLGEPDTSHRCEAWREATLLGIDRSRIRNGQKAFCPGTAGLPACRPCVSFVRLSDGGNENNDSATGSCCRVNNIRVREQRSVGTEERPRKTARNQQPS